MRKTHPLRQFYQGPLQASRGQIAQALGLHPGSVRAIDSGYARPSWDLAFRLEELTGCSAKILRQWPLRTRGAR